MNEKIYHLHASVCQTLANPKRLQILDVLRDQEMSVTELAERIGISPTNLSQHLAVLRQKGVVTTRREGVTIYYRIAYPKILKAFEIMREVLFEVLEEQQRLLAAYPKGKR